MRKMASVVTIKDILPVPKTDNLVVMSMHENLFNVLCNKCMNLNVGDKAVYFEVDSILPIEEPYEFLRSKCYNDRLKGFRIKAMKMRGIISQGLLFSGDVLGLNLDNFKSGDDLTDILHVRKFEPVDDASPRREKMTWKTPFMRFKWFRKLNAYFTGETELEDFPTHLIPKSDEDNLWNNPQFFEQYHDKDSYISVKMEGKSVTCYKEPKKFSRHSKFKVFGRNKSLYEPDELKFFEDNIKNKVEDGVIIQGEFCSPKILKGIYQNGTHYYVYKIKRMPKCGDGRGEYFTYSEMLEYCKRHDLETVPMLEKTLKDFKDIPALYKYVETMGFLPSEDVYRIVNPKRNKNALHHEGIVIASCNRNELMSNWSFKVKSQEYMLGK